MGKNEPGKARSGLSRIIFSRTGFILLLILIFCDLKYEVSDDFMHVYLMVSSVDVSHVNS